MWKNPAPGMPTFLRCISSMSEKFDANGLTVDIVGHRIMGGAFAINILAEC